MPTGRRSTEIQCYCALCVSRCGASAVVEDDRFVALKPDPSHPTGKALCAKGRAAPELVYHQDRLLYPLKRTRPKGDPDPGWQRISWQQALDTTARHLRRLARDFGPECVVFTSVTPSASAIDDSLFYVERLMRAFGSPNLCAAMELCGWGRFLATTYTYGASVPGRYMPDLEQAGCILYWGYNPNLARISHATATMSALKRGAKLIVVDPRRTGIAKRADLWLQVRPGTDAALALGITRVMIERGWFDKAFIRDWTNGPLLVREDNGRLLTEADVVPGGGSNRYFAWDETSGESLIYDPEQVLFDGDSSGVSLSGRYQVKTLTGETSCRPAFDLVTEKCRPFTPERVADICGVEPEQVTQAARLLWEYRPTAYYAWSGVEMQTNATQIARAIGQLYALTGNLDMPGGNVLFDFIPTGDVTGKGMMTAEQRECNLGLGKRPLGPARWQFVTTDETYRAILEHDPYAVKGMVGFGSNLLLSHADGSRGKKALEALDFYVHADLFMNPTAETADIVLPVSSAFERDALRIGFEGSPEAASHVQFRQGVVPPRGVTRSDTQIIFDLAQRLGLGEQFWDGDIDAAYREQLAPSGISLEELRARPGGISVANGTRYRKFAQENEGVPRGFKTPTGRIELYSETLLAQGYPPLPAYEEPLVGPHTTPELAEKYPLVLTTTKHNLFCESQHRALPTLRKRALDPEVELHPKAAAQRGISPGDWVYIETPIGRVQARAVLDEHLPPDVVCGQHGWWQACPEIGAPGYDAFSEEGANLNLVVGNGAIDPVSGSVPHRAYLCEVRPVEGNR